MIRRVYLDTNVFIAAFEGRGEDRDEAWSVLNAAGDGRIEGVTSELTLAELLSKPPSENPDLTLNYAAIISPRPGLTVAAVSRTILIEAARIRSEAGTTKLPDAIHMATAIIGHCACIVTGDRRLRRTPGPPTVHLGPRTVDEMLRSQV